MVTQLKKGSLEMCVLALIDHQDCYGFEIVEKVSEYIDVSEGSIYPLLRRLTDEGYIKSYMQESKEGPTRKYYFLTEEGKTYFQESYNQWLTFNQQVNALLNTYQKEIKKNAK